MILLIFDIDGTLIHPIPFEDTSFADAFRAVFGVMTPIDTNWSTYEHVTDSGLFEELSNRLVERAPTADESDAFRAHYESLLVSGLSSNPTAGRSLDGACAFWEAARKREDWSLAFATGNWRTIARLKLDRAGISRDGLPLATADDAVSRPDLLRAAIRAAQQEGNGQPFDCIISIGDAEWDVRAAAVIDVPFVGVGRRWQDTPHPMCAGYIRDFRDPARLFQIIDGVTGR